MLLKILENTKKSSNYYFRLLGINIKRPMVSIYKGIDVLANGMVERLPNVPVLAQNIGLKQGEIMEIKFHLEALMLIVLLTQLNKKIGEFLVFIEIKINESKIIFSFKTK